MSNAKFIWFVIAVAANVLTSYVIVRGFINPEGLASVSYGGRIDESASFILRFGLMAVFILTYGMSLLYFCKIKKTTNE